MAEIPREQGLHTTRAALADPYRYISGRCAELGSELFETRLLGFRAICMSGPESAKVFYESGQFDRSGAAPHRLLKTLFGQGGVQTLDGERHAWRKRMFTTFLNTEQVRELAAAFADTWRCAAGDWARRDQIVLYDELRPALTRAVCDWAGVPLAQHHLERRCGQLTALYDGAGAVGSRYWRARMARGATQRWIEDVVASIRTGQWRPPEGSAAHEVAWHLDSDRTLLNKRTAAVELLNILRPTVAVAVYIAFVAHAMHRHPGWRRRLVAADDDTVDMFVQEVRRFYPFFPAAVARARADVDWHGYRIPAGSHVVLDLYGTNHDPRAWDRPDEFYPERFGSGEPDMFSFVPQGGGQPYLHHRCPGEPVTTELMKTAVAVLSNELDYELPEQDMDIDFSRLPALPNSGIVLRDVRSYV